MKPEYYVILFVQVSVTLDCKWRCIVNAAGDSRPVEWTLSEAGNMWRHWNHLRVDQTRRSMVNRIDQWPQQSGQSSCHRVIVSDIQRKSINIAKTIIMNTDKCEDFTFDLIVTIVGDGTWSTTRSRYLRGFYFIVGVVWGWSGKDTLKMLSATLLLMLFDFFDQEVNQSARVISMCNPLFNEAPYTYIKYYKLYV